MGITTFISKEIKGVYFTTVKITIAVTLSMWFTTSLATTTTYNYTGYTFDAISDDFGIADMYTSSDRVTGQLTFSSALDPNLNTAFLTPTSFSFSDGRQMITSSSSNLYSTNFFFWTDSVGQITGWLIDLSINNPGAPGTFLNIATMYNSFRRDDLDRGQIRLCETLSIDAICSGSQSVDGAAVYNNQGIWEVATVPVPAAIWLFGTGLIGLVGVARRKA